MSRTHVVVASVFACLIVRPSLAQEKAREVSVATDTEEGLACFTACRSQKAVCENDKGEACASDYDGCKLRCPDACWTDDAVCNAVVKRRIEQRRKAEAIAAQTPRSYEDCVSRSERKYNTCVSDARKRGAVAASMAAFGTPVQQYQTQQASQHAVNSCQFNYAAALDICRTAWAGR